jgi:hypothetical protein
MSFLYKADPVRGAEWARLFAAKAPDVPFHIWPDIGQADRVRYLAAWVPPPDMARQFPNLELFFSTGAATLSFFLGLPLFCSRSGSDLKDLGDAPVSFPGVPPMPASHLVDAVLDRGTDLYATALDVFGKMAAASGILVNTFEALEGSAVAAIRDGRCCYGP